MSDFEKLRDMCLSLKGVTEDTPFDETTLCFRVGGKIFAITDIESRPLSINLKCNPEKAVEYREHYDFIKPGWHMNKTHWNTVIVESDIDETFLMELIEHSYDLIFSKLTKKQKSEII